MKYMKQCEREKTKDIKIEKEEINLKRETDRKTANEIYEAVREKKTKDIKMERKKLI